MCLSESPAVREEVVLLVAAAGSPAEKEREREVCVCVCQKAPQSGKKSYFSWLQRKPRGEEDEAASRRHTHSGLRLSGPAAEGGRRIRTRLPAAPGAGRLPRLHDVHRRAVPPAGPQPPDPHRDPIPEDIFHFLRLLGCGSYGKVRTAHRQNKHEL